MDKGEKRTFTLLSKMYQRGKTVHNYVKLFEMLNVGERFDEQKVEAKIARTFKGKESALAQMKKELYDRILQSLRYHNSGHKGRSIGLKIRHLLEEVELLYHRSLIWEAAEILENAKKLVYEYEKYLDLPVILNWEKHIAVRSGKELLQTLADLDAEERLAYQKIITITRLLNIGQQMLAIHRAEGMVRNPEKLSQLNTLIKDPVLNECHAQTYEGQTAVFYHYDHAVYNHISDNIELAFEHYTKMAGAIESNVRLFEANLNSYINAISNIAACCSRLSRYEDALMYLEKLKKVSNITDKYRLPVFRVYHSLKISLNNDMGNFEASLPSVLEVEQKLEGYRNISYKITFYSLFTVTYFGLGKFEKALHWCNLILDEKDLQNRGDLIAFAKIFNLFIHYELGNTFLMEHINKSAQRFLQSRNRLYDFERQLLAFFRKLSKAINKKEEKTLFKTFKKELFKMSENASEQTLFLSYFDLAVWLDAKIRGVEFAQALKEKTFTKL